MDFMEFPPAKGKVRPMTSAADGQILAVQVADLSQTRKVIPDLSTWLQCYALFVAVLAPEQPERMGKLIAYQSIIAKASQKYRWPSWVIYDQSFRQEMAARNSWPVVGSGGT
jgi:hypothetical protein